MGKRGYFRRNIYLNIYIKNISMIFFISYLSAESVTTSKIFPDKNYYYVRNTTSAKLFKAGNTEKYI